MTQQMKSAYQTSLTTWVRCWNPTWKERTDSWKLSCAHKQAVACDTHTHIRTPHPTPLSQTIYTIAIKPVTTAQGDPNNFLWCLRELHSYARARVPCANVELRGQLWSWLSSPIMWVPEIGTKAVRFGSICLYPLRHLSGLLFEYS